MKHLPKIILFITLLFGNDLFGQIPTPQKAPCPSGLGAWYMYFVDHQFKESKWGFQSDIQHRNFDLGGDMQQIMLRGGITYRPENTKVKLTLGIASITGGEFGDGKSKTSETRVYQEAIIPNKIGNRLYLNHRFRYEQRFMGNDDFRTRYRYAAFLNLPLNSIKIEKKTIYLALYNELFINGQQVLNNGNTVPVFGANRTYAALGYGLKDNLKIQIGVMRQSNSSCYKDQLQLSLHHKL